MATARPRDGSHVIDFFRQGGENRRSCLRCLPTGCVAGRSIKQTITMIVCLFFKAVGAVRGGVPGSPSRKRLGSSCVRLAAGDNVRKHLSLQCLTSGTARCTGLPVFSRHPVCRRLPAGGCQALYTCSAGLQPGLFQPSGVRAHHEPLVPKGRSQSLAEASSDRVRSILHHVHVAANAAPAEGRHACQ